MLAFEGGDVVVQQPAQALDAFLELVHAGLHVGELDAVGVVLDDRPAGADAHVGAAARQLIDGA